MTGGLITHALTCGGGSGGDVPTGSELDKILAGYPLFQTPQQVGLGTNYEAITSDYAFNIFIIKTNTQLSEVSKVRGQITGGPWSYKGCFARYLDTYYHCYIVYYENNVPFYACNCTTDWIYDHKNYTYTTWGLPESEWGKQDAQYTDWGYGVYLSNEGKIDTSSFSCDSVSYSAISDSYGAIHITFRNLHYTKTTTQYYYTAPPLTLDHEESTTDTYTFGMQSLRFPYALATYQLPWVTDLPWSELQRKLVAISDKLYHFYYYGN